MKTRRRIRRIGEWCTYLFGLALLSPIVFVVVRLLYIEIMALRRIW